MELTSKSRQDFDLRVKNKLFESFKRSKRNDALSEKQHDLAITPAGKQFLQGNIASLKQLKKFNRILYHYLKENTLHFMFTEKYMDEKPFRFFEETVKIFANNEIEKGSYISESSEDIVVFRNTNFYVFNTEGAEWQPKVFELSIIDDTNNSDQKELLLWIFALAHKLNFTSYIGDDPYFQELIDPESDWNQELDDEDRERIKLDAEIYLQSNAKLYYDQVNERSKKTTDYIKKKINLLIKGNKNFQSDVKSILDSFDNINIKSVYFLHTFQFFDECVEVIRETREHISNYNLFTYDMGNHFEEDFAAMADETIGNVTYTPYYAPIKINGKGNLYNYQEDLNNVSDFFDEISKLLQKLYTGWVKI